MLKQNERIRGRLFDSGDACELTISGSAVSLNRVYAAPENVWIAPCLFDPQINGYAGIDFQRDGLSAEELHIAIRGLRSAACGQFFFTLTTDEWPVMLSRLRHARALRARSKEIESAIIGWHIEGPFLSSEPGFHGAHNPKLMRDPTAGALQELRAAAGDDPLLLTLAPERPGAMSAIEFARSLKMRVSLGHSDASIETLTAAVKAGATGYTHLGNGCPQLLDRHDNIILRVLDTAGLCASLIPDGLHVSPALFRLMNGSVKKDFCYTTDAISAAGAPPGRYTIGKIEVDVAADQVVRMPGQTNFAGSALRPIDGIFRAEKMLRKSPDVSRWSQAWSQGSLAARRYAGLPEWPIGGPFCVLNFAGDATADAEQFRLESGAMYGCGQITALQI